MQEIGYTQTGIGEVILKLTRGYCYCSLAGGTKGKRTQRSQRSRAGPPGGNRSHSRACLAGADASEKLLSRLELSAKAERDGEKYPDFIPFFRSPVSCHCLSVA